MKTAQADLAERWMADMAISTAAAAITPSPKTHPKVSQRSAVLGRRHVEEEQADGQQCDRHGYGGETR